MCMCFIPLSFVVSNKHHLQFLLVSASHIHGSTRVFQWVLSTGLSTDGWWMVKRMVLGQDEACLQKQEIGSCTSGSCSLAETEKPAIHPVILRVRKTPGRSYAAFCFVGFNSCVFWERPRICRTSIPNIGGEMLIPSIGVSYPVSIFFTADAHLS